MKVIFFPDLGDNFLNHGDYSLVEAMPPIERIKRTGIPLIITTSKTRRAVEQLQRELDIREPFIVENGGGFFFPSGDLVWLRVVCNGLLKIKGGIAMKDGAIKQKVKRCLALLVMILVLAGCGAAARQSGFYEHNTMYQNWDHLKFSIWGYKQVDQKEAQLSKEHDWWGIPVDVSKK